MVGYSGADPTLGAMTAPQPGQPNPNATPEEKQAYAAGWTQIFSDPAVRAGLLQFGTSMMADKPIQQSGGGAFAQAVGSGAEAFQATSAAQQATQQADIKNQQADQGLALEADRNQISREGQALDASQAAATQTGAMDRLIKEYSLKAELEAMPPNMAKEVIKAVNERLSNTTFDATFPKGELATPEAIEAWKQGVVTDTIEMIKQSNEALRPGPVTPAPDPTAPVAPETPVSGAAPPVPPALAGKSGLQWSPSKQRFYDSNGVAYNQQGVPVS